MNADAVEASGSAAQSLAKLQAALPQVGGVMEFFTGGNGLGTFSEGIVPFGAAMKSYGDAVAGINAEAITASAVAAQSLAQLQTDLPNVGGVMTFFDGSNDLGTFAAGIVPFGAAMKSYGDAVADINTGAITVSAVAGRSLARLQESLPLAGGVMEFFNGSHDLAAFAAGIIPFGAAMKSYSDAVADINPTAVETSASAGQALVELANTLPNTGGLLSFFTGGTDLTAFGDDLTSFGADLAAYAAAIKDVKPEAVTASANAASALSNLATGLPDSSLFDQWFGGDQTLASFGADISKFGASMKDYYNEISGIDLGKLSDVITQVWDLIELAEGVNGVNTSGLTKFADSMKKMGDAGISGFTDAFYNCGKLQDVTFPETLKSLDERSFGGCSAFTRIIIDIPAIANYAFWNCANVTSIDLGEKVTSIGRNAFISVSNLQTITCRAENAPSLGNSAFGSAGSKVEGAKILYVPAASYDAYETAWTDVTSQGYALQDINDQQLTDGIYYRASRETDWVPTLPATFTALYVRTVGDDAALTASQFNTVITKISAQSAPVTLDLNMAKFEATEFPTGLAGNAKLGTIKFFENTASIAAGAFKGCTALTKATVPTGVEIIGESTFEGCTALASLTLPSSVKTVGDKAFKGCSALVETSLSAIENIGTEAFAGTGLTSAKISATTLGEKSFRDCTELTAITLGSATTIPAEMFAGCTAITTVTIPASVQTIGASAFEGCSKLATLTLGSGVTTLGDRAFADCGLTALALPDNVTTLGDGAFSNNPNIATLQFGAGLTAISNNAFATNDAIENLTIPKTIVTIGAGSFSDWSKLTKLTISGNTLTSIGSKAFENAALLADVYAEPTTAPAVQADSFSGAGTSVQGSKTFHVASVEAYSSWTTAASGYTMEALGPDYLSEGLYYRASGEDPWKSEIPQTFTTLYVKTAGDNTVMTAEQMKAVADAVKALAAPATVDFSEVVYESKTFPNSFKSNANLAGIVFPQNVTKTASAAFQKTGMTSVTLLKGISYGSNAFDSCASLVSVTVEEGVTEIGNYMFQNTKLTDVTLPNSVTKIGASAFNGCSLTTINFGQGVKTIENSAFQNCGELTEIILPDATETLGQNAFGDCPKLAKISLGKNMKTLEAYCFVGYSKGCPLLGDIICRATTPPTLKDDYGTGPFGGGWSPVAGKDVPAENRIIHLPKSADPVGGTGAYADSSWVKLTSSTYGFAFKYDVEG